MTFDVSSSGVDCRRGADEQYIDSEWTEFTDAYQCRVRLIPEDVGGYSAHALRLPGVVSQGESVEEALSNIAEAFRLALEEYQQAGERIPWTEDLDVECKAGCLERWIVVNV